MRDGAYHSLLNKMNNDTLTTNLDSEEIIAGVVMITMGTLCFIISVIVIAQITRESAFHNAFGYLCLSNLAANSAELLINVLWTGPATLLQFDESVTHSFIGGILAQLILLFWFAIIYGHLEIAINRIVAIAWPVRYSKIFAGRNVIYFITCSWILSFIHSLWYSWYACPFWFDANRLIWKHPVTCSSGVKYYVNFIHGTSMSLLMLSINTVTSICIWRRIRAQKNESAMEQQTSMLRMNIRFYVQGCIGSAVIILAYTSLRIVSPLAKTRMQLFLATTLLMEIVHMCDGIILVAFNKHFRDIVLQPQRLFKKT